MHSETNTHTDKNTHTRWLSLLSRGVPRGVVRGFNTLLNRDKYKTNTIETHRDIKTSVTNRSLARLLPCLSCSRELKTKTEIPLGIAHTQTRRGFHGKSDARHFNFVKKTENCTGLVSKTRLGVHFTPLHKQHDKHLATGTVLRSRACAVFRETACFVLSCFVLLWFVRLRFRMVHAEPNKDANIPVRGCHEVFDNHGNPSRPRPMWSAAISSGVVPLLMTLVARRS